MWSPAASPILVQWRTQLLACPTITTDLGMVQSNFHAPNFDFLAESYPACLLGEKDYKRVRYAEGANGLISFTLLAKLFVKLTPTGTETATDLETIARKICVDLFNQFYGLAWRDIDTSFASDPTPAQRADGANTGVVFRSITITANVGLDRK